MRVRTKLYFLIVLLGATPLSYATSQIERVGLTQISGELQYLKNEVKKVSEGRRTDDVESFDYESLLRDLDAIQAAIDRHVSEPSRQPRKIAPLEAVETGYVR